MSKPWNRGYSVSFINEQPVELQMDCPICLNVLFEPVIATCCGYDFCSACITPTQEAAKPCPVCDQTSFLLLEDKLLVVILNELEVYCPNRDKGCNWTGKLGECDGHLGQKSDPSLYPRLRTLCQFQEMPPVSVDDAVSMHGEHDGEKEIYSSPPETERFRLEIQVLKSEFEQKLQQLQQLHEQELERLMMQCEIKEQMHKQELQQLEQQERHHVRDLEQLMMRQEGQEQLHKQELQQLEQQEKIYVQELKKLTSRQERLYEQVLQRLEQQKKSHKQELKHLKKSLGQEQMQIHELQKPHKMKQLKNIFLSIIAILLFIWITILLQHYQNAVVRNRDEFEFEKMVKGSVLDTSSYKTSKLSYTIIYNVIIHFIIASLLIIALLRIEKYQQLPQNFEVGIIAARNLFTSAYLHGKGELHLFTCGVPTISSYYHCANNIASVPFIGEVEVLICDSRGGEYWSLDHDITL